MSLGELQRRFPTIEVGDSKSRRSKPPPRVSTFRSEGPILQRSDSEKSRSFLQNSRVFVQNGVQPGRNVAFCVGQIVIWSFVFIYISGSIFIFNIFVRR
jgi:hypothetical protein